jgi:hypothetical protein
MTQSVPHPFVAWVRRVACLALLCALAACGSSQPSRHAAVPRSPSRYYPPPGPPGDPWGPYIHEASGRFSLPEQWIRSVMRQESGGQEDVISWAGAIGLMQVMPDTYAGLRDRYSLGNDPFDPHDNILAGTAYLKEMYDRYGSPGFLAAYNAGPNRVDKYLYNGTPLPAETVHYVAAIAPRLGPGTPMTGPLSVYGGRGVEVASGGFRDTAPIRRSPTPAGCDPDAAYDPDAPCTPILSPGPSPVQTASVPSVLAPSAPTALARIEATPPSRTALAPTVPAWTSAPAPRYAYAAPPVAAVLPCDPDAAYDPNHHCVYTTRTQVALRSAPVEATPALHRPMRAAEPLPPFHAGGMTAALPAGRWAIQVGAYPTLPGAQSAAERARAVLPDLLRRANVELPPTAPLGNQVAFRAQLTGLPAHVAADACAKLSGHGIPCMTLPPERT